MIDRAADNDGDSLELAGAKRLPSAGRVVRQLVESVVFFLLAALIVEGWFVSGWWFPLRIAGSSMVPTFLGPHVIVRCSACGIETAVDQATPVRHFVCPACGHRGEGEIVRKVPGDIVTVWRIPWLARPPRRWEAVVLRNPDAPAQWIVKRIVGLPGERVRLAEGDVFIDGKRRQKPWGLTRQTAVWIDTTDDRRTGVPDALPPRWHAAEDSAWHEAEPGRWVFHSPNAGRPDPRVHYAVSPDDAVDWLAHRPPGGAVTDFLYYTPERSRGNTAIAEGGLEIVVSTEEAKAFWVRLRHEDDVFWFDIPLRDRRPCRVLSNFEYALVTEAVACGGLPADKSGTVEVSIVDRILRVTYDGAIVVQGRLPPEMPWSHDQPLEWAVGNLYGGKALTVERLATWRDVFYRPGPETPFGRTVVLGPNEYYLLGDNPGVSDDSRTWQAGPGVPREYLIGQARRLNHRDAIRVR